MVSFLKFVIAGQILIQSARRQYQLTQMPSRQGRTRRLPTAKAFYQEFTTQATTNSNPNLSLEPSSCIMEAEEYARNAAAMIAFFKKAVAVGGSKQLSSVCDAATLAYIDALVDKKPNEMAKKAAADAYVRALTENPSGDPNGACFEAAQELL